MAIRLLLSAMAVMALSAPVWAEQPAATVQQQLEACQVGRAEFSVQAYNLAVHRDQVEREKAKAQVEHHNADKRAKLAESRVAQLEKQLADAIAKLAERGAQEKPTP